MVELESVFEAIHSGQFSHEELNAIVLAIKERRRVANAVARGDFGVGDVVIISTGKLSGARGVVYKVGRSRAYVEIGSDRYTVPFTMLRKG